MNPAPHDMIDGYFDEILTPEQLASLSDWIKSSPENARVFANAALLHDRMRNAMGESALVHDVPPSKVAVRSLGRLFSFPSVWSTAASIAVVCFGVGLFWFLFGQANASAAIRELNRIIAQNTLSKDRTYEIVVEEVYPPIERGANRPPTRESLRPPKPPLDGARVHVREGNQFVLIRKTSDGLPFVTGSNGKQSWAANARGPVKVSADIHHFDRDLPGHETSIPLTNLHEGLGRLRQAYQVQFSTLGPEEYEASDGETVRMLVAVKKPKERGPQRVEIAYETTSGRILHMRFVQMPYGPDRLDLRLSLVNENDLPLDFFQHTSHHSLDRNVETEN
ncbi:MAG: hypothetical protein NTY15_09095 [Planctomycetota bacterium]|nr:hypothetical protein [Planctomycetota bacterium]